MTWRIWKLGGRLGMKSERIKRVLFDIANFNSRETIKRSISKKISMDVFGAFVEMFWDCIRGLLFAL